MAKPPPRRHHREHPDRRAEGPSQEDYAKDQLSKYVYPNVLVLRNAWEGNPVIRSFLLGGSSGSSSAYKVLSNMITGSRDKIFTWRDSAYMDSLFRSALDLQAVQFNLIVQMRIAEDTSPATVYQQDAVKSLFSTYQSSKGSPQAWLEARSGSDTSKCAPQGSLGQGSDSPDSCLWPQGPLWTSQLNEIIGDMREVNCTSEGSCQPPGGRVVARIPYGWHFDMFDLGKNGIGTCDLVTPTVDWSRYKDHGSYSYTGPKTHPDGTQHCTAGLVLVRKLSDQEQSQYYF